MFPHLNVDPADITDATTEGGKIMTDGLQVRVVFFKYL